MFLVCRIAQGENALAPKSRLLQRVQMNRRRGDEAHLMPVEEGRERNRVPSFLAIWPLLGPYWIKGPTTSATASAISRCPADTGCTESEK